MFARSDSQIWIQLSVVEICSHIALNVVKVRKCVDMDGVRRILCVGISFNPAALETKNDCWRGPKEIYGISSYIMAIKLDGMVSRIVSKHR
jgi:hypothetical protein